MQNSSIEWTHHTFNPWEGCTKVSNGCLNCYADRINTRLRGGLNWGLNAPRRHPSQSYWDAPILWNRRAEKLGERHRVFSGSMCDVFEGRDDLNQARERLFTLIDETPHLDWLLLTKRPENIVTMTKAHWPDGLPYNVWMGTSAENQTTYNERVEALSFVKCAVKFVSLEPLLGPIVLNDLDARPGDQLGWYLDWVIMGGESGGARDRAMRAEWARDIVRQVINMDRPLFFKQWGSHSEELQRVGKHAAGHELDGVTYHQFPASQV